MITKKVVFIALTVFFMSSLGYGQTRIGARGGLNIANQRFENSNLNTASITGFQIGVVSDVELDDKTLIGFGLLLSQKGSKLASFNQNEKSTPIYVEMPLNIIGRAKLDSKTNLNFSIGPYFAFGFGGRYKSSAGAYPIAWGKDYKNTDMGGNVGIAIESDGMILGLQYGFGLSDIAMNPNTIARNRVLSIYITFMSK